MVRYTRDRRGGWFIELLLTRLVAIRDDSFCIKEKEKKKKSNVNGKKNNETTIIL